jgi:hypothetical protein
VPKVKVCIWNVQNYGSADAEAAGIKYGPENVRRNEFIAAFVRQQQIDVLMVLEAFATSALSLRCLLRELNTDPRRDWAFCLCGSSLQSGAADPPADATQLQFSTDGRSEGYAVFWRTAQQDRFEVLQGLSGISIDAHSNAANPSPPAGHPPLNLTTKGRPADQVIPDAMEIDGAPPPRPEYLVEGGYVPPETTPFQGSQLMPQWPFLKFPTTGSTNPNQLKIEKARRPAYVVLKLNTGNSPRERLCPVAAYHAPSREAQASWGALQAGLSRELYVTNEAAGLVPNAGALVHCDNTVFGGDFNYFEADWPDDPGEYRYFTFAFDRASTGGAKCSAAPVSPAQLMNCTTVQILEPDHTTERQGGALDDYLALPIDLAFYRAPTRSSRAERVNLMKVLQDDANAGGPVYGAVLRKTWQALTTFGNELTWPGEYVDPALGPQRMDHGRPVPIISGAWGGSFVNYRLFRGQVGVGRLSGARQIAEFLHMFVSDHLPLTVTLEFPARPSG